MSVVARLATASRRDDTARSSCCFIDSYRFLIVAAAAVPFGFFIVWLSPSLTSSSRTSAASSAASSDLSTRNVFSRFVFGRFEILVFGVDLFFFFELSFVFFFCRAYFFIGQFIFSRSEIRNRAL